MLWNINTIVFLDSLSSSFSVARSVDACPENMSASKTGKT
jgi:hypothetical protein